MKATYVIINGEGREIFKSPVTDDGMKLSAKGLLRVVKTEQGLTLEDQVSVEEENTGELKTVFEDGELIVDQSLSEIRAVIAQSIL